MVFMDQSTRDSLDFQYVLNGINPITPYGQMYKSRLKAYVEGQEDDLINQLNKLESYIPYIEQKDLRREFNNILSHVKDLRNSVRRAYEDFTLTEVELFEIKIFLFLLRDLKTLMDKNNMPTYEETEINPIRELEELLDPEDTKITTFYIYDNYSEELKEIRESKKKLDREIKLYQKNLRDEIKSELGLDLRPDSSVLVSKTDDEKLKKVENYKYLSYVSETYMNIKFSIKDNQEMAELNRQLTLMKDREEREELRIREQLTKSIGKKRKQILRNMANIGRLDLMLAKARYAVDINGIKPSIINEHKIKIVDGVHPKVRDFLKTKNLKFTPISLELGEGATCITGANMGGKSISLKLVGLLSAMAQYGIFIPAESMEIGLNNYIKSSIGDMQSTDSGLSTFGGEVKIVSNAISRADERGLILIDELARGTNPEEGHAISKAVVEYLKDKKSITLLTTHYDNIANSEGVSHLQVVGLSKVNIMEIIKDVDMEEKMDFINKYMDYRLIPVGKEKTVPRDALNIATIMGLDSRIIKLAEEYLNKN